ncbi:MAG: histidine--tRNA ligase [Thermofilum sp. ex4484_15]|nr:MAG: histidine--tRNA ligase [Thermofilum sp. ex4484_15]
MKYSRPRGTRDYLPPESYEIRRVLEKAREIFELYGYSEVITPAFERLELLEAKAGPEIKEQIYWFKDKGGRLLGLRFDVTTSIARIVASSPELPKPMRFYYLAPVWRYEEPQRGRLREFWQAGVELIGSSHIDADAEVIALTYRFFRELGLSNLTVRINDRRIADALAVKYGLSERKDEFFRALDKLYKQGRERVGLELRKLGLNVGEVEEVLDFIRVEEDPFKTVNKGMEALKGYEQAYEGLKGINELISILLDWYGLPRDVLIVDFSIVRGIGYYTGLVFEFLYEGTAEVRNLSLAGGGRYDKLIEVCGGPNIPATGMSVGVERVVMALKGEGLLQNAEASKDVIVVPTEENLRKASVSIAEELRSKGIKAVVDVNHRNLRRALEYADKLNMRYAIIIGRKEYETGKIVLKDLKTREQREVELEEAVRMIKG